MNQSITHSTQTADRNSFFVNFTLSTLVSCVLCLVSCSCYAQTTDSALLVDEDASFNYYKIIEQRNFFRPKKDQPEIGSIPIEANKKPEKDSFDLVLTGVIEIKNGYKAIVEQKSTKKGFYVSVNEAIEDYTVKSIMLNKIIIQKDGKDFELKLQQAAPQKSLEPSTEKTEINIEQEPVIMEDDSSPQTLRTNTIQQIRSGTRGTK